MRYKTFVAMVGGVAAVLPAVALSGGTGDWAAQVSSEHSRNMSLVGGFDPKLVHVNVDGTLPEVSTPTELPLSVDQLPAASVLPGGLLGIPGTALRAYRNAADIMAMEQPNCHIDWALIASIGRIESNHARGGYVDLNGRTLEPILGPELNGIGSVAAIPDTDHGVYDFDPTWDRAVGPTQFIPSTWLAYASDGNGDGVADPSNIFDATLATGRYLCSGGLDLSKPDQLRAAIYRYNNSSTYVDIVILWAEAYRRGVLTMPDSQVPIGTPPPPIVAAPPQVTPPPMPTTTSPPPSTGSSSTPHSTGGFSSSQPSSSPSSPSPTCTSSPESSPPSSSSSPPSSSLPPCDPGSSSEPNPSTSTTSSPTTAMNAGTSRPR
ncbi:MAG TPA: lytic murein transglycosylase [Amycolatopsis sp.]|uniref:lytic transglycosylase domain-containing protein n=1 Tax=Amycolatopsis sp. TaxID=37632 RepID=UPI002B4A9DD9|nr:lytic murein transglycosylase [Amycolatopsis sp.]HKS48019.1 lytic murein transglycosylase [Amycolatopsis sp.]